MKRLWAGVSMVRLELGVLAATAVICVQATHLDQMQETGHGVCRQRGWVVRVGLRSKQT